MNNTQQYSTDRMNDIPQSNCLQYQTDIITKHNQHYNILRDSNSNIGYSHCDSRAHIECRLYREQGHVDII